MFKGITSNRKGEVHHLNCFRSYSMENKLKKHENVCKNHGYCNIEMSKEDDKI